MHVSFYLEEARDQVLRDGHYGLPSLFLDFADNTSTLVALDMNDNLSIPEQCRLLYGNGKNMGEKHQGVYLSQITFVSEAWQGETTDPKQEEKRKDVLVVSSILFLEKELQGKCYTMPVVRGEDGQIIAVEPSIESKARLDVNTASFYEGYLAGAFSSFIRYMHRFYLHWMD